MSGIDFPSLPGDLDSFECLITFKNLFFVVVSFDWTLFNNKNIKKLNIRKRQIKSITVKRRSI